MQFKSAKAAARLERAVVVAFSSGVGGRLAEGSMEEPGVAEVPEEALRSEGKAFPGKRARRRLRRMVGRCLDRGKMCRRVWWARRLWGGVSLCVMSYAPWKCGWLEGIV